MKDLAQEKRITVKEAARKLGCNPETIKGHIRALFPGLMRNGKTIVPPLLIIGGLYGYIERF
jgi:hypothetical protein